MAKLACADFGFECPFETQNGTDSDLVLEQFGRHMNEEHGIEYSKEELRQLPISDKIRENSTATV